MTVGELKDTERTCPFCSQVLSISKFDGDTSDDAICNYCCGYSKDEAPVAKDRYSELPDELRKLLVTNFVEMVRTDLEMRSALERMNVGCLRVGPEAMNSEDAKKFSAGGDIIHLNMDPYLVKLRSLHASLQRMVADGHYVTPTVSAILDALETEP